MCNNNFLTDYNLSQRNLQKIIKIKTIFDEITIILLLQSNKQPYNSLHKIKRSVSGALNGVLSTQRPASDNPSGGSVGNNGSANWYLSRSAPTSLDNGQMSPAHLDKSSESPSDPVSSSLSLLICILTPM